MTGDDVTRLAGFLPLACIALAAACATQQPAIPYCSDADALPPAAAACAALLAARRTTYDRLERH